jgi:hypothetical protein
MVEPRPEAAVLDQIPKKTKPEGSQERSLFAELEGNPAFIVPSISRPRYTSFKPIKITGKPASQRIIEKRR